MIELWKNWEQEEKTMEISEREDNLIDVAEVVGRKRREERKGCHLVSFNVPLSACQ